MDGRNNGLNFVRLLLAAVVIISHAFPLSGYGEDPFQAFSHRQTNIGGIAVIGFFAISGYVITKSAARNDILQYLWHRCLRIFPAYILVLAVGAYFIGPVVWLMMGRNFADYFSFGPESPASYIFSNRTLNIVQWGIHDIFATNPYKDVFNGSIWTLTYEWSCYLVLGALVLLGALRYSKVVISILAAIFFTMQVIRVVGGVEFKTAIPMLNDGYFIQFCMTFMLGALVAVYAERIVLDIRIALVAFVLFGCTIVSGIGYSTLGIIAVSYIVIWAGACMPRTWKRIGRRNDISYGVYLYGWLIAQFLAYLGVNSWGYFPYLFFTLVITFIFALLSWHFLEKRALALKDWGPGRGLKYWYAKVFPTMKGRSRA